MRETKTSQKGRKGKGNALLFESRILFKHIVNQEMFITDIRSDRSTEHEGGASLLEGIGEKLRDILLENRSRGKHKAAAGGGVQRKRGRTKRSKTQNTKSVRPFHRENTESKRYVTDLV